MQTTLSSVELFHLLFLRQLEGNLDKKLYALKGGCNLRFFFKSIRYSEDIDFDVAIIAKTTLENKINKILASSTFKKILQSKQIEIIQSTPTKQTDTTQRWKVLLRTSQSTIPIPTKIDFSCRKLDSGVVYAPIDNEVVSQYQMYPIICNHYEIDTAFMQKINALIFRTETQARDIFDLKWLLDQGTKPGVHVFSSTDIKTAIANIKNIKYAEFKGQVVAYLMSDYQAYYADPKKWDDICSQVESALQGVTNEAN